MTAIELALILKGVQC